MTLKPLPVNTGLNVIAALMVLTIRLQITASAMPLAPLPPYSSNTNLMRGKHWIKRSCKQPALMPTLLEFTPPMPVVFNPPSLCVD